MPGTVSNQPAPDSDSGVAAETRGQPRRTPVADWRAIALDVVEIGAAGRSLHAAMAELMPLLQRHLGFDSAALAPLASSWTVTWNKPPQFERLWRKRGAFYVQEVAGLLRLALGDEGVAHDADVLSSRVRERASFYDEYMRPLGGGSFACVGLTGPRAAFGLSLTRYGRGRFHGAELELLRRLRPSLSLAVRGSKRNQPAYSRRLRLWDSPNAKASLPCKWCVL